MPAQDGSGGMLEMAGYASLFDQPDHGGDIVRRGAFTASLKRRAASGVRMLFQHDSGEPIGVWDFITEDARGLYVRGRILGRCAARAGSAGAGAQRRGGRSVHRLQDPPVPALAGGGRDLLELDLWEVSIVTFPMLAGARLSVLGAPAVTAAFAAA